jgi:activating signal cointegrator 1
MKVITVIQPWATLIALGEKKFETRSWATKYRGELGIHASKKIDREACRISPIVETLNKHGIVTFDDLPTGVILATARLDNSYEIHIDHSGDEVLLTPDGSPEFWLGIGSNEFQFGWYEPGRFAWELADVKQLPTPIPAKGQLG